MRACFPVGFSPLPFLALLDDPEEAAPVFPHIRPQTPLARIVLVLCDIFLFEAFPYKIRAMGEVRPPLRVEARYLPKGQSQACSVERAFWFEPFHPFPICHGPFLSPLSDSRCWAGSQSGPSFLAGKVLSGRSSSSWG